MEIFFKILKKLNFEGKGKFLFISENKQNLIIKT